MLTTYEQMCAARFSSEEEAEERDQAASQLVGYKPELPSLPPTSARDGDGSAKAEGEAQGKAKCKAKAKAKAKPKVEVQVGVR